MVCFVRLTHQPSSPAGELSSEWGSNRARQRLNVFSDLVSEVLCHLVTCESCGQPRFKRGGWMPLLGRDIARSHQREAA